MLTRPSNTECRRIYLVRKVCGGATVRKGILNGANSLPFRGCWKYSCESDSLLYMRDFLFCF